MSRRPGPAADATGSPRTQELVEMARSKLGSSSPPLDRVRRYAALLAAAERYAAFEQPAANTAHLAAHAAEGAQHGIDGRLDPAEARATHHKGIQRMSQLLPVVREVRKTLERLKRLYHGHQSELPASLKRDVPEARLWGWLSGVREFEVYLSFGVGIEPDGWREKAKQYVRIPDPRLPKTREALELSREDLTLLWWCHLSYPGKWDQMAPLAELWELSNTHEPQHLRRQVVRIKARLKKTGLKLPSIGPYMRPEDRALFDAL